MFFSKRAFSALSNSSRCAGDNSFLLLFMFFIFFLQGASANTPAPLQCSIQIVSKESTTRTSSLKAVSCRSMANALSPTMTLRDFENGYWYLDQLKSFAERIGIPAAKKLRKDELENAIVAFLRTGNAALPTKRSLRKTGIKDVERGLNLELRIENYTSNRETKDFIVAQARMISPDVCEKSGVWYRLNRWREEQITTGEHPTYGDLV